MKWLLILLSLLYVFPAYASCEGGTEITGKNGHVYCASNVSMNWYTAFAWCDAHGKSLATMEQICNIDETQKWDGNNGEGRCLNMVGAAQTQHVWSSISSGSTNAFYIDLSTGNVYYFNRTGTNLAFCW